MKRIKVRRYDKLPRTIGSDIPSQAPHSELSSEFIPIKSDTVAGILGHGELLRA
jgi:hypothetical protein